jgi:hypothetical protein
MKKLNILSTLLFLFVTVAACQNNGLWQKRIDSRLQGKGAPNSGPAPDYSDLYFWAASPYKHDPADSIPAFLLNEKREELADVFFIHPTTYLGETEGPGLTTADRKEWRRFVKNLPELSWNADLSDETLNYQTDIRPYFFRPQYLTAVAEFLHRVIDRQTSKPFLFRILSRHGKHLTWPIATSKKLLNITSRTTTTIGRSSLLLTVRAACMPYGCYENSLMENHCKTGLYVPILSDIRFLAMHLKIFLLAILQQLPAVLFLGGHFKKEKFQNPLRRKKETLNVSIL